MKRKIILASGSPRRKELLSDCGVEFEVSVSGTPEARAGNESPEAMGKRLALAKALSVASKHPDAWVIGADTDVYIDDNILGKPTDAADAARLLRKISGRSHSVWGAYAVVCIEAKVQKVVAHETRVTMAHIPDALIQRYVASGEPMDKAGAYAAQGLGAQFIERVDGSFTNVVGLNICALMQTLRELHVIPS